MTSPIPAPAGGIVADAPAGVPTSPAPFVPGTYVLEFDRVGRHHNVAPLTVHDIRDAGQLYHTVWRYTRTLLRSPMVEVSLNHADGTGMLLCGMHNGGTFTFTRQRDLADTGAPA